MDLRAPTLERILLIDDSLTVRIFVAATLGELGYRVEAAGSAVEGLERASQLAPDLVLLDAGLPDAQPERVVSDLDQLAGDRPVVLLFSGLDEHELSEVAARCGADGFVTKTHDPGVLHRRILDAWGRLRAGQRA